MPAPKSCVPWHALVIKRSYDAIPHRAVTAAAATSASRLTLGDGFYGRGLDSIRRDSALLSRQNAPQRSPPNRVARSCVRP